MRWRQEGEELDEEEGGVEGGEKEGGPRDQDSRSAGRMKRKVKWVEKKKKVATKCRRMVLEEEEGGGRGLEKCLKM